MSAVDAFTQRWQQWIKIHKNSIAQTLPFKYSKSMSLSSLKHQLSWNMNVYKIWGSQADGLRAAWQFACKSKNFPNGHCSGSFYI